jgi:hypothetical protein
MVARPIDEWPQNLTPTWVVFYLSLYWTFIFIFNYQDLPHGDLFVDMIFLPTTAGVLWWFGAAREIPAYFVGRLVPSRKNWKTMALAVIFIIAAFYAFG